MLIKFTIGNYLSFKNKTTIDLSARAISELFDNNVFNTGFKDLKLLRSYVLYGYNSSGKSNLLKAINFVRWFIVNSSKDLQAEEDIGTESFMLNIDFRDRPSYFEVEFINDGLKYRYGFEVDKKYIHKEWLFQTKKLKEYNIFSREGQSFSVQEKFLADKGISELTRTNALFLSVAAQFNNPIAISILKNFQNIKFVSGIEDKRLIDYTANLLNDPKYQMFIRALVKGAYLGFNDIEAEQVDISDGIKTSNLPKELKEFILKSEATKEYSIKTEHEVFDLDNNVVEKILFNLARQESQGTKKFFSLAGPIIETLLHGRILIIDEFDARLHPVLSKALIQLFNSQKNNPKNAQLIFATHDSSFLGSRLFRRDQVLIINKDDYGASMANTLFDQKIRKDASYEKDYLSGKTVKIPSINLPYQLKMFED